MLSVVITGPFFKFLLRNHFITELFFKKKSGEAKDSAIFAFYFLLHKRAKPILPPYLLPHLRARTQTLYSPLTFSLTSARELKPFTPLFKLLTLACNGGILRVVFFGFGSTLIDAHTLPGKLAVRGLRYGRIGG